MPLIVTESSYSTNDFIGLDLRPETRFEESGFAWLTVTFMWYKTKWGVVGLNFARVDGRMQGLDAELIDHHHVPLDPERPNNPRETENETEKKGSISVTTGVLDGSFEATSKTTQKSDGPVGTLPGVPVIGVSRGASPRIHFGPTTDGQLLRGQFRVRLKLKARSAEHDSEGVLSVLKSDHLTLTHLGGTRLGAHVRWLARSFHAKHYSNAEVKLHFKLTKESHS